MIVSEADVEKALQILDDEAGAAARAAHEYFSDLTKSVMAELMTESNETAANAKEMWARSQPRFLEHLKTVGKFAREDYSWRARYAAAEAKIGIWRTEQSTARAAGGVG
jgi:hypothetical protein